jgi:hypothetical protein
MIKLYEASGYEAELVISDLEDESVKTSKVVTYLTDRSDTEEQISSEPSLANKNTYKGYQIFYGSGSVVLVKG